MGSNRKALSTARTVVLIAVLIGVIVAGVFLARIIPANTLTASSTSAAGEFTLAVTPHAFPLTPGWGRNITISIVRNVGFQQDVNVGLAGTGPSWVHYQPAVIKSSEANASMYVAIEATAVKGPVQLSVEAVAQGSANQFATVTMRVVGVRNVTDTTGRAEVFETTKVLDSQTMAALTTYDNSTGNMQFSQVTPALQGLEVGDVIVGPPRVSNVSRNGFLRTILAVQQTNGGLTLATEQASILELFRTANIHQPLHRLFPSGSASSVSGYSVQAMSPDDWNWNLGNGYSLGATLSFDDLGLLGDISIKWWAEDTCMVALGSGGVLAGAGCVLLASFAGGLDYFDALVQGPNGPAQVVFGVSFKGNGGQISTGTVDVIPDIFGPSGFVIPVFPPFLWFSVNGALEASVSGNLGPTDIEATETLNVGPIGVHCCGWNFEHNLNGNFQKKVVIGLQPGDSLRAELGPRVDLSVDSGILGGSFALHAFLELNSGSGWPSGKPTITNPTNNLKIDLTNVNGGFGPGFDVGAWKANAAQGSVAPGVQVSCAWTDDQLGQIGHSDEGDCNLDHGDVPTMEFFTGPAGIHHITVEATWTNLPPFELDAGLDVELSANVVWGAWNTNFGPQDLFSIPIWKGAASGSYKTGPSDPVAVIFLLPTPTLQVLSPSLASCPTGQSSCTIDSSATVYAGTIIALTAQAKVWTGQGYEDLCHESPDQFAWFYGSNPVTYNAGIGYWVKAQMIDVTCNTTINLTPGPATLTLAYMPKVAQQDQVEVDNNGNPIYISITLNVQPKPQGQGGQGGQGAALSFNVIPVSGTYSAYGMPPGSTPLVFLEGDVQGGTPPYRANFLLNSIEVPDGHWLITTQSGITGSIVAYTWDLGTNFCNLPLFGTFAADTVTVTISVYDHNNIPVTGNTGQFTISCQKPAQELQPIFDSGLITLMSVLLAVTAERNAPTLKRKPPLPRFRLVDDFHTR